MNRTVVITMTAAAALAVPAMGSAALTYLATGGRGAANYPLMLAGDDGSGATRIASATFAAISPDGTKVAYQVSGRTGYATRIMDLASRQVVPVTGDCMPWSASWSPDSRQVACLTESATRAGYVTGNGLALLAVPASLAGITSLSPVTLVKARGNGVAGTVAFSPDSQQIAYSNQRFGSGAVRDLFVMPIANPAARRKVLTGGASVIWGPQGMAVARERNVTVRIGTSRTRMVNSQIWLVDPNQPGAARQLTRYRPAPLVVGPYPAAWMPDGSALVGAVGGQDYSQAIRVDIPSGRITNISRFRDGSSAVAVSADGQRVLIQAGWEMPTAGLQVTSRAGTGTRTIVRRGTSASVTAGWSPG